MEQLFSGLQSLENLGIGWQTAQVNNQTALLRAQADATTAQANAAAAGVQGTLSKYIVYGVVFGGIAFIGLAVWQLFERDR